MRGCQFVSIFSRNDGKWEVTITTCTAVHQKLENAIRIAAGLAYGISVDEP